MGRIWRVASVAERVLSKRGGRAPGWGRACPALGGLSANAECWLDCLAVLVLSAVGAGAPVCMPVGLRVLRGLGREFALLVLGGLPPRRCVGTASSGIVEAKALAVAAAASSTARRIFGSVAAAAAASAAACRAAAFAWSARLCCRAVGLIMIADAGSAVAEALAALAEWSLSMSWARRLRFMVELKDGSLFVTA